MSTQPMTTSEKVKQLLEAGCWVRIGHGEIEMTIVEYHEDNAYPFITVMTDDSTDNRGAGFIDDVRILEIIPRKPKMYPVGTKVRWGNRVCTITDQLSLLYYVVTDKVSVDHVSHFDVIPVWDEEEKREMVVNKEDAKQVKEFFSGQKFEYTTVTYVEDKGFLSKAYDSLDEYGENGWELVSVVVQEDGTKYFFKRLTL